MKGLRFGSTIGHKHGGFEDPLCRAIMARECGLFVPENEMKWQALRPAPDRFDFAPLDELLA